MEEFIEHVAKKLYMLPS